MQSGSMGNDVYCKSGWVFGDNLVADAGGSDSEVDSEEERWADKRQQRQGRKDKRLKKRAGRR